jgi:hypothetical protein
MSKREEKTREVEPVRERQQRLRQATGGEVADRQV